MPNHGQSGQILEKELKYLSRLIKDKDGQITGVSCLKCNKTKMKEEFSYSGGKYKSRCKPCVNNYTREYARKKSFRVW